MHYKMFRSLSGLSLPEGSSPQLRTTAINKILITFYMSMFCILGMLEIIILFVELLHYCLNNKLGFNVSDVISTK